MSDETLIGQIKMRAPDGRKTGLSVYRKTSNGTVHLHATRSAEGEALILLRSEHARQLGELLIAASGEDGHANRLSPSDAGEIVEELKARVTCHFAGTCEHYYREDAELDRRAASLIERIQASDNTGRKLLKGRDATIERQSAELSKWKGEVEAQGELILELEADIKRRRVSAAADRSRLVCANQESKRLREALQTILDIDPECGIARAALSPTGGGE